MTSHLALSRAFAAGLPFDIGGELRLLEPMRLRDWGVLEQILLMQQKEATSVESLPADVASLLHEEIKLSRSVDLGDIIQFSTTEEGAGYRLWLALRQQHSHANCAGWVHETIQQGRFPKLVATHNQADGIDLFAYLDWPKILEVPGGDKSQDWKTTVRWMAEFYHFDPQTLGDQTLYQIRLLQWDLNRLQGRMSKEEAKQVIFARRLEKLRARPAST